MKLDIIIPVGPGHKQLVNEAVQSVKIAMYTGQGPFSDIKIKGVDDTEGKLGRSKARNTAIQASKADWLFFLDADDLMHPEAFTHFQESCNDYDAIWGRIVEEKDGCIVDRYQLTRIDSFDQLLEIDPYYTLQMGFFVKREIMPLFDESMDTGEDWKVYLELWKSHSCIKINKPFMINRRGVHSTGEKSATGRQWMETVKALIEAEKGSQMIADVTHYTKYEGGKWIPWPFPKHIKPSNPELLTITERDKYIFRRGDYWLQFHSLKLSNGREFDTINGFRDDDGPS